MRNIFKKHCESSIENVFEDIGDGHDVLECKDFEEYFLEEEGTSEALDRRDIRQLYAFFGGANRERVDFYRFRERMRRMLGTGRSGHSSRDRSGRSSRDRSPRDRDRDRSSHSPSRSSRSHRHRSSRGQTKKRGVRLMEIT